MHFIGVSWKALREDKPMGFKLDIWDFYVAVATTVMWLVIVLVARLGGKGSGGFVHDTATRFMGLIVITMGVQFALTGMRSFMRETRPTLTYSDREPADSERTVPWVSRDGEPNEGRLDRPQHEETLPVNAWSIAGCSMWSSC